MVAPMSKLIVLEGLDGAGTTTQARLLAQALAERGHVAEGVSSAPMVLARARALGVEMPITQCVVDLLAGRTSAAQAVRRLMARDARAES